MFFSIYDMIVDVYLLFWLIKQMLQLEAIVIETFRCSCMHYIYLVTPEEENS